jgi:glycosyltransferase involved in cell wall biosynthesis
MAVAPGPDLLDLSILVPCLNEAASLPELTERVHGAFAHADLAGVSSEIVLVDDGSEDDSWACIERLQVASTAVRAARHSRRLGIPAAWRTGVAHARGEWICVLDADLQYAPEEIPRLWRAMAEAGVDIVQGVRSVSDRAFDFRWLLSRSLSGLLNVIFGMSSRDNKSGFFLCRRTLLAALLDFRGRFRHWQCFVMVAAHHRGCRIVELETPFRPRRAGQSAFGAFALRPALAVAADLPVALREYPPVRR